MAEGKEASQTSEVPPPFLEVICRSSGKSRRFAPGTKAGFALSLINNKLDAGNPSALYIEAAKDGEEPVSFGPSSALINYGQGWKLQTVLDCEDLRKHEGAQDLNKSLAKGQVSEPVVSFLYIGKILVVFALIFLIGGFFTLALENLPKLLLYVNSSL